MSQFLQINTLACILSGIIRANAMNGTVNEEMNEFWNGEGARKWLQLQDRMDINLMRYGHEAMDAGA